MSSRTNKNTTNPRKKGKRGNGANTRGDLGSALSSVIDISRSLSNGSAFPVSDLNQSRMSMTVPIVPPRAINEQLVWTRCTLDITSNLSAAIETNIASFFRLNMLPNAASWQTLFDQYCIPVVVCEYRASETETLDKQGAPRVYSTLDHDDANTITVAQAKAYSSCYESQLSERVTRVIYPRLALAAYSGVFTSFANNRCWVDCASDTVQHYGIKFAAEVDTRAGGPGELLIRFTIYFAFRNHH